VSWFSRLFVGSEPDLTTADNPPVLRFGVDVPAELLEAMTAGGAIAPRISRDEALQVPAVLRSRNLIAGTLASLPHVVHGPDRREVPGTYLLGGNIDPDIPNSVVWAQTYEDLLFEGVAWWKVTAFGWHGFPINATHVPVGSVHVAGVGALTSVRQIGPDQPYPVEGQVYIDGLPVTDREVIRFDSPNPPLLVHAARAIRSALKLDRAAALYSDDPLPLGYFSPKEGVEVGTREEIQDILDEWEEARSARSWGYVGAALDAKALQWDPEQLQLADQRQHAVLEIARAAGVDPEDLGVSTTSRTYANAEQRRIDLLDFTLGAYVSAMQDRLSMRDVLPPDYMARIKFAGFLRSDTKTRYETYKIGREINAVTDDEIRELENRPALPSAPADAEDLESARGLAEMTQKIYLGVGTVITEREAREILNRAGAKLKPDAAVRAPSGGRPATREPAMSNGHKPGAQFADDDASMMVTFDDEEVYESFSVDADKRTISGLLVPWGKVARSGFHKWKFAEGSLRWSSPSRVKLNLHHDRQRIIAYATRLTSTSRGLEATFKVGSDAESEQALRKAKDRLLDGLSAEVGFDEEFGDSWQPDPSDESVRLVHQASLGGGALTGTPAFDDARIAASRDQEKVHAPQGKDGRQGRDDRRGPVPRVRVRSRHIHPKPG
jgi:phage head maturation protease